MNKLSKFLLFIVFILITIIIILSIILFSKNKQNYDLSFTNEVNVKDILKMFDSNKTYVVYVGRESCEVCNKIIPILIKSQKQNNYITQYLDITKVDRSSNEFKELVSKLTMKSTQTLTEDGSGEEVTETYGYFLDKYGFTPTIIVIKEGKQYAGFIGGAEEEDFINWISEKVN